jgi:hypothetical protein
LNGGEGSEVAGDECYRYGGGLSLELCEDGFGAGGIATGEVEVGRRVGCKEKEGLFAYTGGAFGVYMSVKCR